MHLNPKGQTDKREGKPRPREKEQGHDKGRINLLRTYNEDGPKVENRKRQTR